MYTPLAFQLFLYYSCFSSCFCYFWFCYLFNVIDLQDNPLENLNLAFDVAEKYLDIPRMLDPEGMKKSLYIFLCTAVQRSPHVLTIFAVFREFVKVDPLIDDGEEWRVGGCVLLLLFRN
jgi:hypothetical protein